MIASNYTMLLVYTAIKFVTAHYVCAHQKQRFSLPLALWLNRCHQKTDCPFSDSPFFST